MTGHPDPRDDPKALLGLAQADPQKALEQGLALLGSLPDQDHVARSMTLRALGISARLSADMTESIAYGEQSVAEAVVSGDPALRSAALMSLGGSLAFAGDTSGAFRTLDQAARYAEGLLLAEVEFQRGSVLGRLGDTTRALASFARALPVFEEHGDRESMAMTLHNRAMVQIDVGNLGDAEDDLRRARSIDALDHREIGVAGIDHGLGVVASMRGDIPLALDFFDRSEQKLIELLGTASETQVSRCEVLLSAGLFREAIALVRTITVDLHRAGLAEDEAEARLVGAHAALLAGDVEAARSWADQAEDMFTDQQRAMWAAIARLTCIQARHQAGANDPLLIEEAHRVAERLDERSHNMGAFRAWLLAGSIALQLGLEEQARRDLSRVAQHEGGPIEIRLQSRLATALLRTIKGDRRGADAAVRAGLDLLDDYQAALGATDIRMGVERHAHDLGRLGLHMALESRRPRRVFAWMERTRGRALVYRPVAPPADEELAAQLAELRQVSSDMRDALSQDEVGLLRRERRLQESIRRRARLTHRSGVAADRVSPAQLGGALGDRACVELTSLDGTLWAIVVQSGRFRLFEIGLESEVVSELQSLRFTMRRLAMGRGSVATAREVAGRLDTMIFGSLRPGSGPLIIVPTPSLHATPWWALSTCQARPVTISPSAELWYRASRVSPEMGHVLVAAGPDLELSDAEVTEVGALYPGATLFRSEESLVENVEISLDGARMAHIASHAFFQFENPMFSSLRLADGDLNVYDIERLKSAPGMVVLSACDSGFTDTHPGEELMGLSSALLSMGTKSIIASVGLVPDSDATKDLMLELHRGLIAGLSPSDALQRAQTEVGDTPEGYVAASSFICIGAG